MGFEINDRPRKILKEVSGFLQKNDLEGMYDYIRENYDNDDIGEITDILMECGIDVMSEFEKWGFIPYAAFSGHWIPESFVRRGNDILTWTYTMNFEHVPGIKIIDSDAFAGVQNMPDAVDLRGLDTVGPGAFAWTGVVIVIIDDNVSIEQEAFMGTLLEKIYAPKSMSADEAKIKDMFECDGFTFDDPDDSAFEEKKLEIVYY